MQDTRDILKIMRTMSQAGITAALLLTCAPAFAQVTIHWAASALGNAPYPKAATMAPDGKTTALTALKIEGVNVPRYLYMPQFNWGKIIEVTYDKKSLGELLGVPEGELVCPSKSSGQTCWDIIAFEGNSQHWGWENSIWFVTDLIGAAAGSFDGDSLKLKPVPADSNKPDNLKRLVSDETKPSSTNPLRFKFGVIPAAEYTSFFDIKTPGLQVGWAGWILIDVPDGIDVAAELFRLSVSGSLIGLKTTGHVSPDPDAFGVIMHKQQ